MEQPSQPNAIPETKKLPQEIERKFIVASIPEGLDNYPHEEIAQGYIAITADRTEVRLRQKGEKYFQTVKSGSGKIRTEHEIEISKEQFDTLWPSTEGKRLEKTRYEIPYEGVTIELDIYHGSLTGLVIAEIEFDSEEDSKKFVAPSWLGAEATENKRYKNQSLALFGIPK